MSDIDLKLCPYRKYSEKFISGYKEHFCQCVGSDCTAWSETDKVCSLCSDKRTFNVEARVDTRYNL
jgi:hypothetical protein